MVSIAALPVTTIFLVHAVLILIYVVRNRHRPDKPHHFQNEVIIAALYFLGGLAYPFMFQCTGVAAAGEVALFQLTNVALIAEECIWLAFIVMEWRRTRAHPQVKADRAWSKFKAEFSANFTYDVKKDLQRKSLHVLTAVVVLLAWFFGQVLEARGILASLGITQPAFSFWLIVLVGYAFVLMFAAGDLLRLTGHSDLLPPWALRWFTANMNTDELETFVSSSPLILSFVPYLFTPFAVFASVALISALADMAASLVGKKWGRHHFPRTSKKTVEGYVAGAFTTFLIVVVCGVAYPSPAITPATVWIMAALAALVFFLVDLTPSHVSDNILNPWCCGGAMVLALFLV